MFRAEKSAIPVRVTPLDPESVQDGLDPNGGIGFFVRGLFRTFLLDHDLPVGISQAVNHLFERFILARSQENKEWEEIKQELDLVEAGIHAAQFGDCEN